MSHIPEILTVVDDVYTDATIYKEFKGGRRSFLGMDGCSLLLIAFTIVSGIGLLLFGLAGSKLILPFVLLFILGSIFLFGDQMVSPLEGRLLGAATYRTGWSPAYVWFVGLLFAGLAGLLTYHWAEIPFRILESEPYNGQFAVFARMLPAANNQAKSTQPTKVQTNIAQAKPTHSGARTHVTPSTHTSKRAKHALANKKSGKSVETH